MIGRAEVGTASVLIRGDYTRLSEGMNSPIGNLKSDASDMTGTSGNRNRDKRLSVSEAARRSRAARAACSEGRTRSESGAARARVTRVLYPGVDIKQRHRAGNAPLRLECCSRPEALTDRVLRGIIQS